MKLSYGIMAKEEAKYEVNASGYLYYPDCDNTLIAIKKQMTRARFEDDKINSLFTPKEFAELIGKKLIKSPEEYDLHNSFEVLTTNGKLIDCKYEVAKIDPEKLLDKKRNIALSMICKYGELNQLSHDRSFVVFYLKDGYVEDNGLKAPIKAGIYIGDISALAKKMKDVARDTFKAARERGIEIGDQFNLAIPLLTIEPINEEGYIYLPANEYVFDAATPVDMK